MTHFDCTDCRDHSGVSEGIDEVDMIVGPL